MEITLIGRAYQEKAPEIAVVTLEIRKSGSELQPILEQVQKTSTWLLDELSKVPENILVEFTTDGVTSCNNNWGNLTENTYHASCIVYAKFRDFEAMTSLVSTWTKDDVSAPWIRWELTKDTQAAATATLLTAAIEDARFRAQIIADHLHAGVASIIKVLDADEATPIGDQFSTSEFSRARAIEGVAPKPASVPLRAELKLVFTTSG